MVPLEPNDRKIVGEYTKLIRTNFPNKVRDIILYGSKARGDSNSESDIDMLIVVNEHDKKTKRKISDLCWDVMANNDFKAYLSSIVFSQTEYEQYRQWNSSFLANVLHEGVRL